MTDLQELARRAVLALRARHARVVLIGGLGVIAWGRIRATEDIDLVVDRGGFDEDREALAKVAFTFSDEVRADPADSEPDVGFFATSGESPVGLDVFYGKTEFEQAVLETAKTVNLGGLTVEVASAEALIVYKLLADRLKDRPDVQYLFDAAAASRRPLNWTFLEKWCAWWGIDERLAPWRASHGAATGRSA
ncbi:MAG: nucleotidyltransferase [Myxococcaceae bacterium]|nr:nucleotidyltransferase [Myxococcaceae bacterium]